jgi:peptidoglycan/xylan/chitin deacetylase (PgdA/CDA1 family)
MLGPLKRMTKRALGQRLLVERLGAASGKSLLLTFDDGPHPETTPRVLRLLDRFGARAVFFVVGNRVPRAPGMLREVLDAGHELGNHSFRHIVPSPLAVQHYTDELTHSQRLVEDLTGITPRFHRPPLGKLVPATLLAPLRLGLQTVGWSASSEDWRLRTNAAAVRRAGELADTVQPCDIILLHDERATSVRLLETFLTRIADQGYNLAPNLDEVCCASHNRPTVSHDSVVTVQPSSR